MYPYLVKLLNVESGSLTPHEHNGEEFFFVLDGELELVTQAGAARTSERLKPGDFCYLDSSVPHLLRSETRNPYSPTSAEVIVVFWCPLGERYLFDD
jgi:mannose-6-phosphate isomerase-like protein (cupin superfamily)